MHIKIDVGEGIVFCKDGSIKGVTSGRKYMYIEYNYPSCDNFRVIVYVYENDSEVFQLFITQYYIYSQHVYTANGRQTGQHLSVKD
jgi:hypothetical protein